MTSTGDNDSDALIFRPNTNSSVTINGGFSGNTVTSSGSGAGGILFDPNNSSTFTLNGGFTNNTITTAGADDGVRIRTRNGSTITFNGGILNNVISGQGVGIDILSDGTGSTITINASFSGNTVTSNTTDAVQFRTLNDGSLTVHTGNGDGIAVIDNNNTLTAPLGDKVSESGPNISIVN